MTHPRGPAEHSVTKSGFLGLGLCKHILNSVAEASHRSFDRSRFANLPLRALDDVGLTIADRDALLR
jgi:hypothetical protein